MKRIVRFLSSALLLALALTLAQSGARAAAPRFSDVPEDHWACAIVSRAADLGLVNGTEDGKTFGLGQPVTCAEYAAMLCRLMDWELVTPETGSFTDNRDAAKWYFSYIETAHAHGALITHGTACLPERTLMREELAAMTVSALGYTALAGTVQDDCPFTDVKTNRGYVTLAQHMGLVNGVGGGLFLPRENAAREQAAAILLRGYDRLHSSIERVSDAPSDTANAVEVKSVVSTAGAVPFSPRAGLESVYDAAIQAGEGGAVLLHTAPYAQTIADGGISEGETITARRLSRLLQDPATEVYRSARYASSYLVHPEGEGRLYVVWYESEEDIAEKVELCRLLGVAVVYTTD